MKSKKGGNLLLIVIIAVFLFVATTYYFAASSEDYQRGNLVGDGVCGNIGSEEGRGECCAGVHADDFVISCLGEWKYLTDGGVCEFVCKIECPEDSRICDDGTAVVRDPENNCEFEECLDGS